MAYIQEGKPVSASKVVLTQIMLPQDTKRKPEKEVEITWQIRKKRVPGPKKIQKY